MSEEIVIPSLKNILPGTSAINERNCVSVQISYTATGGSFSIVVLKGIASALSENTQLSLPYGRVATLKSLGQGYSSGGLTDVFSGPIVPPSATLPAFAGLANKQTATADTLAQQIASPIGVFWETFRPVVRNFVYRGVALNGVVQLASLILADVLVRSGGIFVVDPGQVLGSFSVPKSDIVSASQVIDYSQDLPNTLNPALSQVQVIPDGQFIYDSQHAQKQAKTTVEAGAPDLQGSQKFIPIPDGWLVDGSYEEWTPPSATDATNPNSTVLNGQYWKDFPSPINPGMRRGITSFSRLVKQINLPGNVSSFVGSPVTGLTQATFAFNEPGSESGIFGFTADTTTFFDIISHQYYTFRNAIVLIPAGATGAVSGDAAGNFYSITMEIWTFPRVNPIIVPVGNPINPFNLPNDVVVVNPPMNNIVTSDVNTLRQYWNKYMQNYRLINSPRLRTSLTCVFRGYMPQVGDSLSVVGLRDSRCGRIQTVSLNLGRSGLVLNITAEFFQYTSGLFSKYPAITQGF